MNLRLLFGNLDYWRNFRAWFFCNLKTLLHSIMVLLVLVGILISAVAGLWPLSLNSSDLQRTTFHPRIAKTRNHSSLKTTFHPRIAKRRNHSNFKIAFHSLSAMTRNSSDSKTTLIPVVAKTSEHTPRHPVPRYSTDSHVRQVQAQSNCKRACLNKRYGDPVCGNDWQTYEYECELTRASCEMRKALVVAYKGECVGTSTGGVRFDRRGREDGCNTITCSTAYEPICGSDGKRYSNECHMIKNACKAKQAIVKVMKIGYQKSDCKDIKCPKCDDEQGVTLCGSDRVTYGSLCHIRRRACQTRKAIVPLYTGPCMGFTD